MSCVNNTNPKINEKIGNQKDSLVLIIQKLDNELKNKNILTQEGYNKGTLLISTFQKYIELYPNDTLVQNYLFDMIMYLQGLNLTNDALIKMDEFILKFPENPRTPELINMQASIYDIEFHDKVLAKKKYQKLINEFPDHPLSINAQQILDSGDLNLTIEERVHKWQKNI